MILSPLPKGQQKRHFVLDHGELIEEDDFDDDDDEDDVVSGDSDEDEAASE